MNRPARKPAAPKSSPQSEIPESLWDKLDQLSASVPLSAWRAVPSDLARNVKHYLNGQPVRQTGASSGK